ncbi:DoxX family membrane protein [Psychromicrobium xiongbiense]|uniref:DoxX family membrane protein n=1 Tax=Psychromicrobium xiongbiense TaxID=3051184 RepID=UPI002554EE61|nr:DoxX family membrane protein [Psychromicrobium sp. YIM S02556]
MAPRLSHLALRLASGAFILNSGAGKLSLDEASAEHLQQLALNAFPQLKSLEPERFGRYLSYAELGVGSALLLPFIPSRLAGLALTGFASGMVYLYLKTPGLTKPDGIRPTAAGTAMAKDFWLLAIGLALLLDRGKRK